MSTATAAPAADAAAPKKGKKKLFILIGVVLLVVALAGGGAAYYLKAKAAAAAAEAEAEDGADDGAKGGHAKAHKKDEHVVPTFVPLDPFTVNLADREAERYAQVGVTLELADPHVADQIKLYMPAIRNNVLMVLAHKTSAQLLEREGKIKLAREIQLETARALGIEVEADAADDGHAADKEPAADAADEKPVKKKKKKKPAPELPVTAVQFSNFIIQ